jgi:hypothetical protein
LKLTIELIPTPLWGKSLNKLLGRSKWDRIRHKAYANASHQCQICSATGKLTCHEEWIFDDEKHVQKLIGFIALCENCHMIKHVGFSMHTEEGRRKYNTDELIKHFCEVNKCSENDFYNHKDKAFEIHSKRSSHQWEVDFGDYSDLINKT